MTGTAIAWLVYGISTLSSMHYILNFFIAVFTLMTGYFLITYFAEVEKGKNEEKQQRFLRWCKRYAIILAFLSIFKCLIPTKEDALYIAGAYFGVEAGKTVIDAPEVNKLRELFNLKLDEQLKDLQPKKK